MGSGGGGTQTVTNRTEVDPFTQQWRSSVFNAGNNLYNQGTQPFYPGSTVVPFSDQTMGGLDYLQRYAQGGAPNLQNANDAAGRMLQGGNAGMGMAGFAAQGGLNNNQAISGLDGYGSANNPHLRGLFDQGADMVSDRVNSAFAQSGRFGANAAHSGAMGREMGNLYNSIYAPAYEAERNRGLQAATTQAGLYDAAQNRQLQGIGLFGDMHAQGNSDAIRTMAMLPQLYSYGALPGQTALDVGSIYEGQAGQYLDEDMQRYSYPYQNAWSHLNNYANLMSGLPDFSGSTQTQRTRTNPDRTMQIMGALQTAASMYGMFAMSDRRLKRDVERIGEHNGTPWYRFRYVWDAPGTVREGVMADEAPAHAVHMHESGYAMVDYASL